jgi:O-antigen/teichoic acid export membrane protein
MNNEININNSLKNPKSISLATKTKIIRNSFWSLLRHAVSMAISFMIIPYMLYRLGTEKYGVWALVGIISSVGQISDFGLGLTLVKSVAELNITMDHERINKIASSVFFFSIFVGGFILGLAFIFDNIILRSILKMPNNYWTDIIYIYYGTVIVMVVNLLMGCFSSLLIGLQKIGIVNLILFFYSVANAMLVYIFLNAGMGLRGLVLVNGITSVGMCIANAYIAKKHLPRLQIKLTLFKISELKILLSYGINMQVSSLMSLLGDPLNKILLTNIVGVNQVSYYDIASRLSIQLRTFFVQAITPLLPASSELFYLHGKEPLLKIFRMTLRYLFLFGFPIYAIVLIVSRDFINIWLGNCYSLTILAFQILLVSHFFSLLVVSIYVMFQGIGLAKYCSLISIETGILSAIFCIIFGLEFKFVGIVFGISFALILTSIHTFYLFVKYFDVKPSALLDMISIKAMVIFCCIVLTFSYIDYSEHFSWSLIGIIIAAFLLFAIYLFSLSLFKCFSKKDSDLITSLFPNTLHKVLTRIIFRI